MTTFVKTLSDLAALLLQSLRLSVLLPAAILVGLNISFVVPILHQTRLRLVYEQSASSESTGIFIVIAIIVIAYALGIMNVPIIRFFEGFFPLFLSGRLRIANARRVTYLQQEIQILGEKSAKARAQAQVAQLPKEKSNLLEKAHHYQMQRNLFRDELIWKYPHHQTWRMLPTRLGNIIAAAEEFPSHLFGIDPVTLWPYLTPILSEEGYATFVEREKASLDFLLNCSVICMTLGAELFALDILMGVPNWQLMAFKIFATTLSAYGFYLLSIQGAIGWGFTIRAAFVLYRDKLRERLGLVRPKGYYQERNLWKDASSFYRDHTITPGRTIFDYSEKTREEKKR